MSKFGINVPPGQAAQSMDEVKQAADAMKDENNEVCCDSSHSTRCATCIPATLVSGIVLKSRNSVGKEPNKKGTARRL